MEKISNIDPNDRNLVDRIFGQSVRSIIEGKTEETKRKEKSGFFQELMSSISEIRKAQKEAKEKSVKLVLGEVEDIHDVMIAREKAEVLFQLFLEVRNRAVQAFENIMRAQF